MTRRYRWMAGVVAALGLLLPSGSAAQSPWTVTVTPTLNPLPVGFCGALHLTVFEGLTQEAPRNPLGFRVTLADFDIAVSTPGQTVVARKIDVSHWETCACQGAGVGTVATVTASYPAQALAPASRVPGVTLQRSATVTLSAPKGKANPSGCVAPAPGTVASSTPAGASPPTGTVSPPPAPAAPPPAAPPPAPAALPPSPPPPAPVPLAGQPLGTRAAPVAGPPAPEPSFMSPTPVSLTIYWPQLAGAVGYTVTRSQPNTQDTIIGLTPTQIQILQSTSGPAGINDSGLLPATVASYVVRATFSDGRESSATVRYTMPPPVNPRGLVAKQTGIDQVQLQWTRENNGASYFIVFGPGSAQHGVKVGGGEDHYDVTGVPLGSQEWAVASYHEPGPITTPAADFSRVQLAVTAPVVSGRYLITITGLRAINMSFDDQLSRDGKGDEIYAANVMRRYDRRSGVLMETQDTRTLTYGDTYLFGTTRVQAGTMSSTGGIRDGDPIPANSDPAVRSLPPSSVGFPLQVWEGTLTDGVDALVLSPTIWEQDVDTDPYADWLSEMRRVTRTLWGRPEIQGQVASGQFGQLLFGTTTLAAGEAWLELRTGLAFTGFVLAPAAAATMPDEDRPIGLYQSGVNDRVLPNAMVVLTREIIEAGLAPLPPGTTPVGLPTAWPRMPRPGVLMIPFIDGPQIGGLGPARYELYLTVERVP